MLTLPNRSGEYRWLYMDLVAGDFSAVVIFMLGSVFSPRYSVGAHRGALPLQHSAVNFALYHKGARWMWVLTEYPHAELNTARELKIGRSTWTYDVNGHVRIRIEDQTFKGGLPARAEIDLIPESPDYVDIQLVEGQPHWWRPLAARARATLRVPTHELEVEGRAYHDGNHGEELLGTGVPSWRWTRLHEKDKTRVIYEPPEGDAVYLHASDGEIRMQRAAGPTVEMTRSSWGLAVPKSLDGYAGTSLPAPQLLESSPFYARLEAEGHGVHAMSEVANFQRFHSPYIRWMANYRTRFEAPSV